MKSKSNFLFRLLCLSGIGLLYPLAAQIVEVGNGNVSQPVVDKEEKVAILESVELQLVAVADEPEPVAIGVEEVIVEEKVVEEVSEERKGKVDVMTEPVVEEAAVTEAVVEEVTVVDEEVDGEEPSVVEDAINVSTARKTMYEAMVNVQDEKYEEAIPKLEWVLEQDPALLGAWETLGWAYWLTDRQDDAILLWTRLVEIAPNEPMGYNLMGQVATRDAEFGKARDLYLKSLELNPSQFEIRVSLAQVMLWGGEREKAIAHFTRLFEEDPERTDIQIDLAWSLYGNEQYEESLEHWNEILEAIPGHAGFLIARANVHLLMGMLQEAEADAYAALEVEPENLQAMNILIALSIRNNRPRETVSRLRELQNNVEDADNKIRVSQQIAVFMNSVFDENPAIFSRDQVIEAGKDSWDLDRNNVGSALFYAEALVAGKEFEAAADVFDFILENLNPQNDRARYGKMETFLGRSMVDEAEDQLVENLRSFNGENPFRHVYWARIHFARGDFQLALKSLERLEREGARGSVFMLLYHGISPSEFSDMPSVRQLREQVMALRRDGFEFMTVSELPAYFDESEEPPPAELDRPWLNRMVQSVKYSWTAEKEDDTEVLSDFTPEKKVIVTFDDGLRNSFRYGTMVAEEIDTKFTMFVGVGDVLSRMQRYVAHFPEIREYFSTGRWEIQSHLWDAGQLAAVDEEGKKMRLPLPNRIWLKEKDRMETLKEYQDRLRKEFSESRRVLARELNIPLEKINSAAYPYGEIGQENTTNIDLFDVTNVILNESEIAYDQGFLQHRFGYAVKGDNPLLYKRFEPYRHASGRYVLRQAYLQHPVFVARRMRAEIAALHGRYELAMENVDLLRRDGYPEEDLRELTKYVDRHLASLVRLPDAVEDTAAGDGRREKRDYIELEDFYIGADARTVRSNELIDEQEIGVFAGISLNRRITLQVRASEGKIEQSFNSPTNQVIELSTTQVGSASRTFNQVINGQNFQIKESSSFSNNVSFQSNVVNTLDYEADFSRQEGLISYIHDSGAFTIFRGGLFTLDPKRNGAEKEEEVTYGVEHQWRPFPNMDFTAVFNHGVVPSAIELVSYDQLAFRPIWRVTDYWQATAVGSFSFYDDNNSFVNGELENIWLISEKLDVWAGLHHSISTTDEASDLYWTPYWEQRHFAIMEIRRSYPGLTTSLRGHLGFQKEKARDEDVQQYLNLQVTAAEQGGFSAGEGPDEDWNKLLGFSANISKTFDWGLELNGSFLVNATKAYTEHNVIGSILYRF